MNTQICLKQTNLFKMEQHFWKLSRNFALKIINCTEKGIIENCHGKCCLGNSFWPGMASTNQRCIHLGDKGCVLPKEKRPVTCLLFPFVLNKYNTLVLFGRTFLKGSRCSANCNNGTKSIIENQREYFEILFGKEEVDKLFRNLSMGKDPIIVVPKEIVNRLEQEKELARLNKPYKV